MKRILSILGWGAVATLGAGAFALIALHRGETINAAWLVIRDPGGADDGLFARNEAGDPLVLGRDGDLASAKQTGVEARIVGEGGAVLAEREVGEIQLRGEAITPGYLTVDGPLDTQDAEGWFATGDIGYLVDGQIIICGRSKDVIILGLPAPAWWASDPRRLARARPSRWGIAGLEEVC